MTVARAAYRRLDRASVLPMHLARAISLVVLIAVPGPPADAGAVSARNGSHSGRDGPARIPQAPAAVGVASEQGSVLQRARSHSAELASGVFLIASQKLEDPNFARTVVLLLKYDSTGALGLVINRPSGIPLSAALPDVNDLENRTDTLFVGGPVERGQLFLLIRSETPPRHAEAVVDGVYASTSLKTLHELISGDPPDTVFHAYAGYAGWGGGQLEGELLRGDWLVAPADAETVFDSDPDTVWRELIRRNSGLWVFRSPASRSFLSIVGMSSGSVDCR